MVGVEREEVKGNTLPSGDLSFPRDTSPLGPTSRTVLIARRFLLANLSATQPCGPPALVLVLQVKNDSERTKRRFLRALRNTSERIQARGREPCWEV